MNANGVELNLQSLCVYNRIFFAVDSPDVSFPSATTLNRNKLNGRV